MVIITFVLCLAVSLGIFLKILPGGGDNSVSDSVHGVQPKISENTKIKKVVMFACNDKVTTAIPTTSKYIGMDYDALLREYPQSSGWIIDDSVLNEVILTKYENKVCPYHREYRHLGISDGYLAVFEGPLGYNNKVLQRDSINVAALPSQIQESLKKAMDYPAQTGDLQAELKRQFEFENEDKLNLIMENFDEFKLE